MGLFLVTTRIVDFGELRIDSVQQMTTLKVDKDAKCRLKIEARRKLPFLVEFGNEEDIIAYARKWNPDISAEQLERVVRLFRDAKRERAPFRQPR